MEQQQAYKQPGGNRVADGLMQSLNVDLPRKLDLPGTGTLNLHQMDQAAASMVSHGTDLILNGGLGVVIVVAGWIASRWLASSTQAALVRARVEVTFAAFLGSVARYLVFLTSVVVALGLLGLNSTSIVALFGAIGLALAFALRNTLSHVASGVMLMVNQPFKVGDYIELPGISGGQSGTVKRVTLFNTEVNTLQNLRIFIPNTQIWENITINHTYNAQRMVEVKLRGRYEDDGLAVKALLMEKIRAHELVLASPEPWIATDQMGDHGIEYVVRMWVRTSDFGTVRNDIIDILRRAMLEAGFGLGMARHMVVMKGETDAA